jgi:hypothetical protein
MGTSWASVSLYDLVGFYFSFFVLGAIGGYLVAFLLW